MLWNFSLCFGKPNDHAGIDQDHELAQAWRPL
jgi:hypothetical protein